MWRPLEGINAMDKKIFVFESHFRIKNTIEKQMILMYFFTELSTAKCSVIDATTERPVNYVFEVSEEPSFSSNFQRQNTVKFLYYVIYFKVLNGFPAFLSGEKMPFMWSNNIFIFRICRHIPQKPYHYFKILP